MALEINVPTGGKLQYAGAVLACTLIDGELVPVSGGGGNATVPEDAPILPFQVAATILCDPEFLLTLQDGSISCNGLGLIHLDSAWLASADNVVSNAGSTSQFDFGGNAIPTEDIDACLAALANNGHANGVYNFGGGTNGAPTGGASNSDYLALIGNGCTVTINP